MPTALDLLQTSPETPATLPKTEGQSAIDLLGAGLVKGGLGGGATGTNVPSAETVSTLSGETSPSGQFILPLIFSTVGSVVGSRGGPVGAAIGSGAGTVLGEVLNQPFYWLMGATPPEKPSLWELAKEGGIAAVLDFVGGKVGRKFFEPAKDAGKTMQALTDTGITPKPSDVSGSTVPAAVERSMVQTIGGRGVVTEIAADQNAQLGRAKDLYLAKIGAPEATDTLATGGRIQQAVTAQVERVKGVEDFLWEQLRGMATDAPTTITSLKRLAADVERDQMSLLPSKRNGKLLDLAKDILKEPETTTWQRVDAWRRDFGASIKQSDVLAGMSRDQSERFYAASLQDMERAAAASDIPGLGNYFKEVRAFGQRARQLFNESQIAGIMDADPEKVVALIRGGGGPTAIQRAKAAILGSPETGTVMPTPDARETWNLFRRHILESAFESAKQQSAKGAIGEPISGIALEKALGKEALRELLDPAERQGLDALLTAAKAIRIGERAGNNAYTSSTGQTLAMHGALTTIGGALGNMVGGPSGALIGATLSNLALPYFIAKAVTSPTVAAFIASPRFTQAAAGMAAANRVTAEGARAILRLGAIVAAEDGREMQQRQGRR